MTSVILVQYNNASLTLEAIRSFRKHHPLTHEIIVVDNASTDGSAETIARELPGVMLIRNSRNVGFGKANNIAADRATGEFLLFLNNDTITRSEFLTQIEGYFQKDPSLAIIGPGMVFEDGSFQLSAGLAVSFWGEIAEKLRYSAEARGLFFRRIYARRFNVPQDVGWVTGAALCIRRQVFREVSGFDESIFMYFEDKDLCARVMKNGYRVHYLPGTSIVHLKGRSSAGSLLALTEYRKSQIAYYEKHRPGYERVLLKMYLFIARKHPE
jgi:GT2 family glycosyltransferase